MRKRMASVVSAAMLVCVAGMLQLGRAQEKGARGVVQVKMKYTGSGTVDEKHKIMVFLFDSPTFMRGQAMPVAMMGASAKDGLVTFRDVAASPVYVGTVYDPKGAYDGTAGPPPAGASMGIYSKSPGEPAPVKIEAGKTPTVEVAFDDSVKMQ